MGSGSWIRRGGVIVLYPSDLDEAEGEFKDVVDVAEQARQIWGAAPDDVKDKIKQAFNAMWKVSPGMAAAYFAPVLSLFRRGMPISLAVHQVGTQAGLTRRESSPRPNRGQTTTQKRQFESRQIARRGRRPGMDPRLERRRK